MTEFSCALLIAIAMIIFLIVFFVALYILSRQNKKSLEAINVNQQMMIARMELDRKLEKEKKLTGLTLQASERIALFLERINPVNMIPRLLKPGLRAAQLEAMLTGSIRDEFEHNMSQQLYLSDATWEKVKLAKESMLNLISKSAAAIKGDAPGSELAKEILAAGMEDEIKTIYQAITALKSEMNKNY